MKFQLLVHLTITQAGCGSSLRSNLTKRIGALDDLSLGQPIVCGKRLVVATGTQDSKDHILICCDTTVMQEARADPILHCVAISKVHSCTPSL